MCGVGWNGYVICVSVCVSVIVWGRSEGEVSTNRVY